MMDDFRKPREGDTPSEIKAIFSSTGTMSPRSMKLPRFPSPSPYDEQPVASTSTSSASASMRAPASKPGRYSVSRTSACEKCRTAKARCSQDRPTCTRCEKHSLECIYDSTKSRPRSGDRKSGVGGSSENKRRRTSSHTLSMSPSAGTGGSTSGVRRGEHRGGVPDISIDPPDPLGLGSRSRSRSRSPQSLPKGSSSSDSILLNNKLATKQELFQLLNTYFTHVYPVQAMSFIHKAQLFRRVEEGRASPLLIKSMCAVSARFLPNADKGHTEGGYLPSVWCQEAKVGIILDTDRFSLSKLAAILCILNHDFNCGRTGSAWIFVAIAVRMARAMGLNVENEDSDIPFIEKETRRRLIWAIYCADCFCSAGWPEYMLLDSHEIHVYLPSDENSFTLGIEQPGQRLEDLIDGWKDPVFQPGRGMGSLMTRWIWLMALRIDLLSYVWRIHEHERKPWDPDSRFNLIVRRLQHWKDTLPPELNFSIENLHLRRATYELDSLAVMHICFDIVHSTLYRITLPSFSESARPEFLASAPRDWIHRLRYAANVRAVAVREKFTILEKNFPDHIPITRLYNLYIFGSLRVQLQYYALACPDGIPDPQTFEETATGFEIMMDIVGKMIRYYVDNRRMLRDMLKILARHGYNIASRWEEDLRSSEGTRTPIRLGYAVSGIPTLPPRHSDVRAKPHRDVPGIPEHPSDPTSLLSLPSDPVTTFMQSTGQNTTVDPFATLVPPQPTPQPGAPTPFQSNTQLDPFNFTPDPINNVSPGDDLATFIPTFDVGHADGLPFFGAWDPFVGAMPHLGASSSGGNGLAARLGQGNAFQGGFSGDAVLNTWTAETNDIDWDALLNEPTRGEDDIPAEVNP